MSESNPITPATPATPDQAPQLAGEIPTNNLEEFLETHGKKTAIVLLLIVAIIGIFYFLKSKAEAARVEAGQAFVAAVTKEDLQAVAKAYAGEVAGGNALLSIADRQAKGDEPEKAKATLTKYVAEHSGDPLYLNGVFALACVDEQLGNTDAAIAGFKTVSDAGAEANAGAPATLRLGDLYAAKGELDKAIATYESLAPKFPESPFFDDSDKRIEIAKNMIIERDNPAPPPEKEPEPVVDPAPKKAATTGPDATVPDAAKAALEEMKAKAAAAAEAATETPEIVTEAIETVTEAPEAVTEAIETVTPEVAPVEEVIEPIIEAVEEVIPD